MKTKWTITLGLCVGFSFHSRNASAIQVDDLGRGIQSNDGVLLDRCLVIPTNNRRFIRNSEQYIDFEQISSFETSNAFMTAGGGVGVDLGLVGGNAEVQITTQVTSDESQISLLYYYQNAVGTLTFDGFQTALTGKNCGTNFVQGIKLGYSLYVNVKLHFLSAEEMKRITTRLTVSALFGLIKKTVEFTDETRELTKDVAYSVVAYQLGGSSAANLNLQEKVTCRLTSSECYQKFSQIIDYSKTTFRSQIENDIRTNNLGAMHPLAFDMGSYRTLGLESSRRVISNQLKQRRLALYSAMDDIADALTDLEYKLWSAQTQQNRAPLQQKIINLRAKQHEWLELSNYCQLANHADDCLGRLDRDFKQELANSL